MPKKSITTFEDLVSELKSDVEFQKSYRKKKPYYDLLNEIYQRRKQLGITQEELAQRAGVPQSNIARLESGEHNIRLSTLIQIAEALEAKVEIHLTPLNPEPPDIHIPQVQTKNRAVKRKKAVVEANQVV